MGGITLAASDGAVTGAGGWARTSSRVPDMGSVTSHLEKRSSATVLCKWLFEDEPPEPRPRPLQTHGRVSYGRDQPATQSPNPKPARRRPLLSPRHPNFSLVTNAG